MEAMYKLYLLKIDKLVELDVSTSDCDQRTKNNNKKSS